MMNEGRTIAERFAGLSPQARRRFIAKLEAAALNFSELPIIETSRAHGLPLSYAQLRQWFLWKVDETSTAYHITAALKLTGPLDTAALQATFVALVDRHESLRTVFRAAGDGTPEQVIQPTGEFVMSLLDLSDEPAEAHEMRAAEQARRVAYTPFDLTIGPLFRAALIRLSSTEHRLVVVMHHIVSDGGSMQIIMDEFVELYRAHAESRLPKLQALPIQYADYAVWQRNWFEAGEKERQLLYWRERLGDVHPVLRLPTDRPRQAEPRYRVAYHSMELPATLVEGLQRRALESGATLFIVLLAGFKALLHRYTGDSEIRVGTTNANRNRSETQGVVGFFVNVQVLRTELDARMSWDTLMDHVRQTVIGAQEHQDLPFEQLVEALQRERTSSHSPLFQVLMNHQRRDFQELARLPGLSLQRYALGEQRAEFELGLNTAELPDRRLVMSLEYAAELFEPETIARFAEHYARVLRTMINQPQQTLGDLSLLNEEEQLRLRQWGTGEATDTDRQPLHRLIEQQAQRNPNATALICGETRVSYGDLNGRANQLARRLIASGVKPEVRVGIALERSTDLVASMLAVLKAGGAYVPLDLQYPVERLGHMLRDSDVQLVLTRASFTARLGVLAEVGVLLLDSLDLNGESTANIEVPTHTEHLAYIIYTSGSTGTPKGVAVSHGALSQHVQAIARAYELTSRDRTLLFASIGFDAAQEQWAHALSVGATVVLLASESPDFDQIAQVIEAHSISVLDLPPAYAHQFSQSRQPRRLSTRLCILGGEAWSQRELEAVQHSFAPERVANAYGPTETVITPTVFVANTTAALQLDSVPIGRPVGRRTAYVLNDDLTLAPQGVSGELYVGGTCLARGYLHAPQLTAQRFIADPFSIDGQRLYRTGDLVRWNCRGQLEYLGRVDEQVKIRGYRIEVAEIETQLSTHPSVGAVVVTKHEDPSGATLVAYLVPRETTIDPEALRKHLSTRLPGYMMPGAFVVLDRLPLTASGKVDRKALPAPEHVAHASYEPPQGEAEVALAKIWCEVLRIERVGRHENFFELGGHSLLLLQVMTRLRRSSGSNLELRVRDLMQNPTIANLAHVVTGADLSSRALIPLNRSSGGGRPLFCFHPGLGTVFNYLPLARHLASSRPVLGIVCRTHLDPGFRDRSLEHMATDYCTMLRSFQPRGPYNLLGWSSGGTLAWMIAQRLEADGEEVEFLGLVDTHVPRLLQERGADYSPVADDHNWKAALESFIGMVAPGFDVAGLVSGVDRNPLSSETELAELLGRIFAGEKSRLQEGYAVMTPADLASIFVTFRHLSLVTSRYAMAPATMRARTHCWWSAEKQEESKARLHRAMGGGERRDYEMGETHVSLISSQSFLESIADLLGGGMGAETGPQPQDRVLTVQNA